MLVNSKTFFGFFITKMKEEKCGFLAGTAKY